MHHVYQLLDATGDVVYVGESKNPKRRFRQHTRTTPNPYDNHGKFYGRTDLALQVIASFETRAEALAEEGRIKKLQGMEWTEVHKGKLTFEQAEEIREKYATGQYTQKALAKEYDIHTKTIVRIVKGKTYIHA